MIAGLAIHVFTAMCGWIISGSQKIARFCYCKTVVIGSFDRGWLPNQSEIEARIAAPERPSIEGRIGDFASSRTMIVRMALILSLIMQLAFSMPCCGLVVFRLDFKLESCEKPVEADCDLQTGCCAATTCCDVESPSDEESNGVDPEKPVCVWCIPLDHKKVDHASQLEIPPLQFISYEFPAVNRAVLINRLLIAQIPPPRWTTSQQRQSLLAVWTI